MKKNGVVVRLLDAKRVDDTTYEAVAYERDTYIVVYEYAGEQWGHEINAASKGEAMERIAAMAANGRIVGDKRKATSIVIGNGWPQAAMIYTLDQPLVTDDRSSKHSPSLDTKTASP